MYIFKLDESLAHSGLNFRLELAMQLRKYIWISRVVEWMSPNLTDKFVTDKFDWLTNLTDWQICAGYNIIYAMTKLCYDFENIEIFE